MPEWLGNAIFYEIYPQSFYDANRDGIGDIAGMRQKLPYIQQLGANAIWINPIFDSPFLDAGYDVRDYKRVALRYGTNEELIEFFAEARKLGIHVILDLVPGHTSYEHEWFRESSKADKNDMSGRYIWTNSVWEAPPSYKFVCGMAERDGNYLVNFFSSQPALNYGFHEITEPWQKPADHPDAVRTKQAIMDVMAFWLDAGCDGFRVDMADSLVKNDEEKTATQRIWRDIRSMLEKKYPEAALISEWSCPQRAIPCGFHADFYLDHVGKGYHHIFREIDAETKSPIGFFSASGREDFSQFAGEFSADYARVAEQGYISLISGNHDTPRLRHFMNPEEMKLAFAFLLTMPGVPFIYYGDEIGMRYLPDLRSKEGGYQRTGTRTPMQWDDSPNKGFSTADPSQLYLPVDSSHDAPTVTSQESDPESLLSIVRELCALRRREQELSGNGSFRFLTVPKHGEPLVYQRGDLLVAINPSLEASSCRMPVDSGPIYHIGEIPVCQDGSLRFAAQSFAVYRLCRS